MKSTVKNKGLSRVQKERMNEELFSAIWRKDENAVRDLLSKGADVRAKDGFGDTPLIKAALKNSPEIMEILLSQGAQIDDQNNRGMTALMTAAQFKYKESVEFLISQEADVNIRDVHDRTAYNFNLTDDFVQLLDKGRKNAKGLEYDAVEKAIETNSSEKLVQQFKTKDFLNKLRLYGLLFAGFRKLSLDDLQKVNETLTHKITAREQLHIDIIRREKIREQASRTDK